MDYIEFNEEIKKIIVPVLEAEGMELVEFYFIRGRNSSIVRLLVDRIGGGITIGDCAQLNRKIGEVLDISDIIKDKYVLEVSSPGLDRPLKTKSDFSRCIHRDVKFFLREAINGKIELEGIVDKVEDDAVSIKIDDESVEIPLSKIVKAKQVIE